MNTNITKEKATEHVVVKPSVYENIRELSFQLRCSKGQVIEHAVAALQREISNEKNERVAK